VDNKKANHRVSIIEIECKLHDEVISILTDPGSNYIYTSLDMVDKCCLNKEVHVESWLV